MIPYSYSMVNMGGIDLAEANGTVVEGLYDSITEAVNACGDVVFYNWKFAGIEIAPSHVSSIVFDTVILINGLIQVSQLDQVTVIGLPPPVVPVSPLEASENGTYEAEPPASGFNPVVVDVPEPVLIEKEFTENGTYDPADDDADGYSEVRVHVSGGSSPNMVKLWENSNDLSTIVSAITLSDSYANYDFLVFVCGYSNATAVRGCATAAFAEYDTRVPQAREGDCYWVFNLSDGTILTRKEAFYLSPKEVYGINIAEGVVLYEREESELTTIPSTVVLSDAYTNYDYLVLEFGYSNDITVRRKVIIPVSALNDLLSSGSHMFLRDENSITVGWNFYVTSTTVFTKKDGDYLSPKAVYGIEI